MTLKITIDKVGDVLKGLEILERSRVLVGVPSDKADRQDDEECINNAALMYIHENGAPEANIPARPVVKPAIASIRDKVAARYKAAAQKVLSGEASAADKAHHAVGMMAQNAMRAQITNGPFEPLSERTLARRKRAGFKGEKPLIRTGQLRPSLTYVIRSK